MFNILKIPTYFRFWLGQVISQLGDGVANIAIVYLVATISKDPLLIGLAVFAQFLPTAIFSIFLGPLADKYNRRWLMTGSDLYRMIIVLLMIPFYHSAMALIVLIAFQGLGSALFDPARSSSIPDLVGETNIQEAVSLSQSTRAAMNIIGPSLGALLMLTKNYSVIFLIDALTFALSALLILTLSSLGKVESSGINKQETYFSSITSGVREVVGMPSLRFLLILLMPIILVMGILNTNLIAVLTNVFHVSAFHFGLTEATLAVGAIFGAAFVGPKALKSLNASTVFLSATALIGLWMVFIIPLNLLQQNYGIAPIYAWCIMVGIMEACINVPLSSLFLKLTPPEFRGRGSSLLNITASSFQIFGILLGGWVAKEIGVLYGTALAGALLIAVALLLPLLKGYKSFSGNGTSRKEAGPQTVSAN